MSQIIPESTRTALAASTFQVGEHSVGVPRIRHVDPEATLTIGRFCTFGDDVEIVLGGPWSDADRLTTYPLAARFGWTDIAAVDGRPDARGDVVIGHDVSVAEGVVIRPGVTIGNGAILRSGSVVSEDVPPYAVVAGDPAIVVRSRFDPGMVSLLQDLAWWNFDEPRLRAAVPFLKTGDVVSLLASTYAARRPADGAPAPDGARARRVFDCILYDGEADVLKIRPNEIGPAVDVFVIVEADRTFSGAPREKRFDETDRRFAPYADRIRHVMVSDMPDTDDPWTREAWQRDAVMRGIGDAEADDLVLLSDADEIPRLSTVLFMRDQPQHPIFGMSLRLSYFALNYCNVAGPGVRTLWNLAVRRDVLDRLPPDALRNGVRRRTIPAVILQGAGWHFSYLMDEPGVRRKISRFSHQEYNNEEFLGRIDVKRCIEERQDLFADADRIWAVVGSDDLPDHVKTNLDRFSVHIVASPP